MDLCGCGAAIDAASDKNKKAPGWEQKPSTYDLTVVAGDSLSMSVTLDWEAHMEQYPDLYLTTQIRGSVEDDIDGFFCDAESMPLTRDELLQVGPNEGVLLRDDDTVRVNYPELYSRVDEKVGGMFSDSQFSGEFDTGVLKAQYVPVFGECGRTRVKLALFPLMTRHLYELALAPDYEPYVPCSHLPPSANVPPTATGYPAPDSYRAGKGWKSAIALPAFGGEYDSRTEIPGTFYKGVWDLQIASVDGRYARTVLGGTITVVGDVSRKVGTDE